MASQPISATTGTDTLQRSISAMIDDAIRGNFAESDSTMSQKIEELRREAVEQDVSHGETMKEIHLLIKDLLNNQVFSRLKEEVEKEINADIDSLVDEEVRACLETDYIPTALQDLLADAADDLEIERRRLHNSESKRHNALLQEGRDDKEPLHTIYTMDGDGEVSEHFPATFGELFTINDAKAKSLADAYGQPKSQSRERNINNLLLFFGIQYQIVNSRAIGVSL